MALSGSKTVSFPGNSNYKLIVEWSATQNINENKSTITMKTYFSSNASWSIYASGRTLTTWVYGGNKSTTHAINSAGGKKILLNTRTETFAHKADGTLSFNIAATLNCSGISISGKNLGTADTGAIVCNLNTIPRKSTLTSSKSFTATNAYSCSVSRASSSFYHRLFLMNGSTRIGKSQDFQTSCTWTLSQAENETLLQLLGTKTEISLTFDLETWNGSSLLGTNSYTVRVFNPRTTNLSSNKDSYDIGESIPIVLDSYRAEYTHTLKYSFGTASGTIATGVKEGTYNWNTSSIASTLYNALPNASSANVTITCEAFYGNTKVNSQSTLVKVLNVTNSNPTLPSDCISYFDSNAATTAVTGNNQYIVQGKSVLRVNLTKIAASKNGATITSYAFQVGSQRIVSSTLTTQSVEFSNVDLSSNDYIYVTATDSRGLSVTVSKPVNILKYNPPVVLVQAERVAGFENATNITASVNYSSLVVGGTQKNTISTLQWQYRRSDVANWSSAANMTKTTINSENIKGTASYNLDNANGYYIQVVAKDIFGTTTGTAYVEKGIPIMYLDTARKGISFGGLTTIANAFEVFYNAFIEKLKIRCASTKKYLNVDYTGSNNTCTIKESTGISTIFSFTGNVKASSNIDATNNVIANNEVVAANYVTGNKGLKSISGGQVITEEDLGNGRKILKFGDDCIGFVGDRVLYSNTPGLWPTETFNWTSPVPLDKCPNGWIIMWSPYTSPNGADHLWGYTYIPKTIIHSDPVKRGRPVGFEIYTKTGDSAPITKYLTITNTGIKGDPDNGNNDPAKKKALRHILVW